MDQVQVDGVLVVGKLLWRVVGVDHSVGWLGREDGRHGQVEDFIIVVVVGRALVYEGDYGEVLGVWAGEPRVPAGERGEDTLLGDGGLGVAGVDHLHLVTT